MSQGGHTHHTLGKGKHWLIQETKESSYMIEQNNKAIFKPQCTSIDPWKAQSLTIRSQSAHGI